MKFIMAALCFSLIACEGSEGPVGPQGPPGAQGPEGPAWSVETVTGTILNQNYTEANPDFASIHIASTGSEPTVLSFGIENENGVYLNTNPPYYAVVWGGENTNLAVSGTSGWYFLVEDQRKELVGENYQLKFVR